jgi:hypothetical protein
MPLLRLQSECRVVGQPLLFNRARPAARRSATASVVETATDKLGAASYPFTEAPFLLDLISTKIIPRDFSTVGRAKLKKRVPRGMF